MTAAQRQANAEKLVEAIRKGFRGHNDEGFEHFVEDFAHNPQHYPFVFGAEDIPYDEYNFTNLGGTAIARRWRDIGGAVEAGDALNGFISNMQAFKGDPHKIIGELRKIYSGMTMYDANAARAFTMKLAKGIIRYYERAWWTQIPVLEYFTGRMKSSYAQLALGQEQAAWDVRAKNIFIEELFDNAMLSHHQAQELMSGTAANKPYVYYEVVKKVAPLLMLGLAIYLLSRALKDTK